ncbi:MAG: AMP-binding protein, partial [Bacteroidaceae bacterium]|nr:AMP-binding protein [Bacteroidaceae bacterium]
MSQTRFSVLIHQQAKKYGDKVALKHRDYKTNTWIPTTWNQFSEAVKTVSNALIEWGVEVQENIGVFTQNKPESLFV